MLTFGRTAVAVAYTDDTFSDTVVEYGGVPSLIRIVIEETRVDEVRRLPLHGTVYIIATFFKLYFALDPCAIE